MPPTCALTLQTLTTSPLGLLQRLPCAPPAPALTPLRRATSMQALSCAGPSSPASGCSSPFAPRRGSHGTLPRAPSLPAVQEHQPAPQQLAAPPNPRPARLPASGLPPRRSQSDTALAQLQQRAEQRQPLWLAEREPRPPQGWGVCSAASLQDLACRQLCASLVQRYQQQCGAGKCLPLELVLAVEEELR